MPRVLKIDSITNRPICKSAGAGGFLGTSVNIMKCHNKARVGVSNQCFTCNIPFYGVTRSGAAVAINRRIGCNTNSGYVCGQVGGVNTNGNKGFTP